MVGPRRRMAGGWEGEHSRLGKGRRARNLGEECSVAQQQRRAKEGRRVRRWGPPWREHRRGSVLGEASGGRHRREGVRPVQSTGHAVARVGGRLAGKTPGSGGGSAVAACQGGGADASTAGSNGVGGVDSLVMGGIRRDDTDSDGGGKARGRGGAHVAWGGRPRVRAARARRRLTRPEGLW